MSLSIINSVFALGAESAYLGTLGVRALEGDWGAALTAAAMADTMGSQAPHGSSMTMGSQAPTATNDVRRFAATPSDWCDCCRPFHLSTEKLEQWVEALPEAVKGKVETSLQTDGNQRPFKERMVAAFANVIKNKFLGFNSLGEDEEAVRDNLEYFAPAERELTQIETILAQALESGVFTGDDFYRGLNRRDPAEGRALYERMVAKKKQVQADLEKEIARRVKQLDEELTALFNETLKSKAAIAVKIRRSESDAALADGIKEEVRKPTESVRRLKADRDILRRAGKLPEDLNWRVHEITHETTERWLRLLALEADELPHAGEAVRKRLLAWMNPLSGDVNGLLQEVVDRYQLPALQRGIQLRQLQMRPRLGPGEKLMVPTPIRFADSIVGSERLEWIAQIVENLVENGLKYFDPAKSEDRKYIALIFTPTTGILEYEDSGIGMAPEFAARLGSEPGLRERDRVGNIQGTGTGWMIMTHNLRALGWTYEIETAPRQGLKVRIRIPEKDLVRDEVIPA